MLPRKQQGFCPFLLLCWFVFSIHNQLWCDLSIASVLNESASCRSRCMTDVWHLKSSGTPGWIESGQINAITQVSGGNGDKGTSSVCLHVLGFWWGLRSRFAPACMEWQTADWPREHYIALGSPQMPYKEPGQKCLANLTAVNVMNAWAHLLRRIHNSQVYVYSVKPLKSPLSFSVRPKISCRAYLKSTPLVCPFWNPVSSLSPSLVQHLLLPLLTALSLHLSALLAREWSLKWSICPRIPIYQPVSACIDRVGIGSLTVRHRVIPLMCVHRAHGLNHSGNPACRLQTYCNLRALLCSSKLN